MLAGLSVRTTEGVPHDEDSADDERADYDQEDGHFNDRIESASRGREVNHHAFFESLDSFLKLHDSHFSRVGCLQDEAVKLTA